MYWESDLEFTFECCMAGIALILFTPFALLYDLVFMIPELIIYLKNKEDK